MKSLAALVAAGALGATAWTMLASTDDAPGGAAVARWEAPVARMESAEPVLARLAARPSARRSAAGTQPLAKAAETELDPASAAGPRPRTKVLVVDGADVPLAGVQLELAGPTGEHTFARADARSLPLGKTEGTGAATVHLPRAGTILALDAERRLGARHAAPGRTVPIRLDGEPRALIVLDHATEEPAAGAHVKVRWTRDAQSAVFGAVTDAAGTLALPVGSGSLEISLLDATHSFENLLVDDRPAHARVDERSIRVDLPTRATRLTARVGATTASLTIVDDDTGSAIDAPVRIGWQFQSSRTGRWVPTTSAQLRARAGVVRLPARFAGGAPPASAGGRRRTVAVPGYEVLHVDGARGLDGARLRVRRAGERRLRFLDHGGRPLAAAATLTLPDGTRVELASGSDGLTDPVAWSAGADWRLDVPRFGTAARRVELAASLLAHATVVDVRPSGAPAAIVVADVPEDAPPLVAISLSGERWEARVSGAMATFEGIPAGAYAVGPWEVAEGLHAATAGGGLSGEGAAPTRAHVEAVGGRRTRVPWSDAWAMAEEHAARVTCAGLEPGLLLALPVHGPAAAAVRFGPETPWLDVEKDGGFELAAGVARPRAFLFARRDPQRSGTIVPLSALPYRSDGQYRIAPSSIELVAADGATLRPDLTLEVSFESSGAAFAAPLRIGNGLGRRRWSPLAPLRLDALGEHVNAVRIRSKELGWTVTHELTPGRHTRVEVVLPESALAAAAPNREVEAAAGRTGAEPAPRFDPEPR
ncbi:MAG: hypothetical protein AAFU73_21920 [Planctomycetota bacterium]